MTFAAVTLDPSYKSPNVTLSNGNLTAAVSSGGGRAVSTRPISGRTYFEILINTATTARVGIGAGPNWYASLSNTPGQDYYAIGYDVGGNVYYNNSVIKALTAFVATNIICVAIDPGAALLWFRINNGNWNNAAIGTENPATALGGISLLTTLITGSGIGAGATSFYAVVGSSGATNFTANFTSASWTYSAPSGFGAISAYGVGAAKGPCSRNAAKEMGMLTPTGVCRHPASKRGGKQFTAGNAGSPLAASVSISGNIQEAGSNVARPVFLFDNNTGELLEKALSNPSTGNFSILARGRSQVIAVALDPTSFQAQVYDRLTPA